MNFNKSERFAFFGSLLLGFLAHGYTFMNNFQYHDDVNFYAFGAELGLGRGSNYLLGKIFRVIFGGDIISLPLFNGILAITIIALTSMLIVKILKMSNAFFAFMAGGAIAVFPSLTSVLGYRFMVWTYSLAYLSSAFGVYLITGQKIKFRAKFFAAVTCFVFAVGIYQSVIPFILSLASLSILRQFIDNNNSWKTFYAEIIKWICICAVFMTIYAFLTVLPAFVFPMLGKSFSFTSYQGFNEAGNVSFSEIFGRVYTAYYRSFYPPLNTMGDVYPMSIRYFFYAVSAISVLLSLLVIIRTYSRSKRQGLQCIIIMAVLPLMINFIYVMCDSTKTLIYSIMEYAQVFTFIYMCFIFELADDNSFINSERFRKYLCRTITALMFMICFLYIRFDNICYLKASYIQSRAISYFTVLQARIQSVHGYKDRYPVVMVNRFDKSKLNVTITEQLENVYIPPYYNDLLNDYTWVQFMGLHCGYSPEVYYCGKDSVFDNPERVIEPSQEIAEQIEAMPHYPDDGAVKVMDEKIFVKF